MIVALTFAFIIPYFFFFGIVVYTQIAKPQRDFASDFLIYASSACIAYCISILNFVIFFAQMKESRMYLKKLLCRRNDEITQPEAVTGERRPECLFMNRHDIPGIEGTATELRQFKIATPMQ